MGYFITKPPIDDMANLLMKDPMFKNKKLINTKPIIMPSVSTPQYFDNKNKNKLFKIKFKINLTI